MKKIFICFLAAFFISFACVGISLSAPQGAEQIMEQTVAVNVNTASLDDLTALPGIGEKTAANIIEYRQKIGTFKTYEDLLKVKGIGEKTLEKIRKFIIFE